MHRSIRSASTRICIASNYGHRCSFQLPSGHMLRKHSTEAQPSGPEGSKKTKRQISLVRLLMPHWKALALGLASAFGSAVADVLQPLPVKIVIDNVLLDKALPRWLAP